MANARTGTRQNGSRALKLAAGLSLAAYTLGSAALMWRRPR